MSSVETDKGFKWLKRTARISAWALLAGIVVLVVSGWGITSTGIIYTLSLGLIDRKLADGIHRATNVPLAVFFLTHVMININLAVSEKHKPGRWLSPSLIVIGLVLLGIVVYMEYLVPR